MSILVQQADPAPVRGVRFAWRCARTDGDDALLVSFMGRPAGFPRDAPPLYVGAARAVSGALLVSVFPTPGLEPLLRRGRAVGRVGLVRVAVEDGWRGREILDAASGLRPAVFDDAALLRPKASAGAVVPGESGDERPSWWLRCTTSTGSQVHVVHTVEEGDEAPRTFGVPAGTVSVRGRTGTVTEERDGSRLVSRILWWRERGATLSVRSSPPGAPGTAEDVVLRTDGLVAFADALR